MGKRRFCAAIALALFVVAVHACAADSTERYPAKPLRFVVPFPPGGGTDILARLVGERLSERLGVQVVIDNRPGAGTNIGTEIVARAVPDGHTLLMGSIGVAANTALYRNMRFDPVRDLQPIVLVAVAPSILVAHPSLAAKAPKDVVSLLKAQPGRINYASFGIGSGSHLAAELFQLVTGTEMIHVPYKGGGPGIVAVLGGEVQLAFSSLLPTIPHIRTNRLVPIGLAAAKRSRALPNVTTFREAGIDYETGPWFGVLVPAKTPIAIVERLNTEINAILRLDEIRKHVEGEGVDIVGGSPTQFARFISEEAKRWAAVVKKANIRVD